MLIPKISVLVLAALGLVDAAAIDTSLRNAESSLKPRTEIVRRQNRFGGGGFNGGRFGGGGFKGGFNGGFNGGFGGGQNGGNQGGQNGGNQGGQNGGNQGGQNGGNQGGQNGGNQGGQNGGNQGGQNGGNQGGQNGGNQGGQNGGNQGGQNGGNGGAQLNPANIQSASTVNGQQNGAEPGQVPSLTDQANFVNFCTGKTLTNGQQNRGGSCNGIVMGDIPSAGQMVSTIIVEPKPTDNIPANTQFTVQIAVRNLRTGSFTNPQTTYYTAPQTLEGGQVVGHSHITIQNLGGLNPNDPPDAQTFAFFKGLNEPAQNGRLKTDVTNGLPAGNYRICTLSSNSNHAPVVMPVAQRGAQDDCIRITIGGNNRKRGLISRIFRL